MYFTCYRLEAHVTNNISALGHIISKQPNKLKYHKNNSTCFTFYLCASTQLTQSSLKNNFVIMTRFNLFNVSKFQGNCYDLHISAVNK